jgi:ketosteroid isomerase-like protein
MNEALVAIHDYYKAFSTLDLDAYARFFTVPCMFIRLRGTFAVANREELARVLGPTFETLRSKHFQRSEFMEPQLTALTENLALLRGVAVRYRASGPEFERVPISYLVQQTGVAWKIAVVASSL